VCGVALIGSGCAGPQYVAAGAEIRLEPDEGLLAVHVVTNEPIGRLSFDAGWVGDFAPGESIALYRVSAGEYHWQELRRRGTPSVRFSLRQCSDWSFRVEAGTISYAGMLELEFRRERLDAAAADGRDVAQERLTRLHPELVRRYPFVYSGTAPVASGPLVPRRRCAPPAGSSSTGMPFRIALPDSTSRPVSSVRRFELTPG